MHIRRFQYLLAFPAACFVMGCCHAADAGGARSPSASDALFDPDHVMQIELRLDPADWHALRISHRSFDADFRLSTTEKPYAYYRAEVTLDGRKIDSVGVRKKGSLGSTVSSRPSLKIKFDEYVHGREFNALEMLTLNNNVQDPSHLQQFLVYAWMRKAGVPAPRCNLARVVVNGEDLGLYSHVESIDKLFLRRHFNKANGELYEGQNGGDFTTNAFNRILHKRGKDRDRTELRLFAELLQQSAPVRLQEVERRLDVNAFIRFWAAEVLLGITDGYAWASNNYYMYRDGTSGRLHFIPWGRDMAFVAKGDWWGTPVPKSVAAYGLLCQRLWELPEIRDRYRLELRRQLDEVWSESALLAEVERLRRLCVATDNEHEAAAKTVVERILAFIKSRRGELESELKAPPPEWPKLTHWTPPVAKEKPASQPMQIRGSFKTFLTSTAPTNRFDQGQAKVEFAVNGQHHLPFTHHGAVAFPAKWDYRDLVTIEIDAHAPTNNLRWRVIFNIDPYRLGPGPQKLAPFALWARVAQGEPVQPGTQFRGTYTGMTGTVIFDQASTNLGSTIAGKFTLDTVAFESESGKNRGQGLALKQMHVPDTK